MIAFAYQFLMADTEKISGQTAVIILMQVFQKGYSRSKMIQI